MREVSGSWSFLASLGSRGVSEPNYVEWQKGEGKGGWGRESGGKE